MKKSFKDALDNGIIIPAKLQDGSPFVVDGVQYYQATEDGFNLTVGRFLAFSDTLRKHDELKLTGEQFEMSLSTMESLFRRCRAQATMDAEQVMDAAGEGLVLINRLRQRQNLGLSIEQVYEVASIFYFADDEELTSIDSAKNRHKINQWLKYDEKGVFFYTFLSSPIGNYIPLTKLSEESTLNFLREDLREESLDWTRMLFLLKTSGASSETMNTIESRTETLLRYAGLLSVVLNPTTTTAVPGSEPKNEN
ncbi:hypothetical protein [Spirosoma sp.]|uniref:hypothetical protein n=1 Tax=Spirosoma sp. TaxID=1899569 RepID=UPI002636AE31|nr:hypothetical protein [Spirosoma sp.]MCX6217619.1 hypothetical protein [Spirosoma sp.]